MPLVVLPQPDREDKHRPPLPPTGFQMLDSRGGDALSPFSDLGWQRVGPGRRGGRSCLNRLAVVPLRGRDVVADGSREAIGDRRLIECKGFKSAEHLSDADAESIDVRALTVAQVAGDQNCTPRIVVKPGRDARSRHRALGALAPLWRGTSVADV